MTTYIRTTEGGHLFESLSGTTPRYRETSDFCDIAECELCYSYACIHEDDMNAFFLEKCDDYQPELPGLETPVVEQKWRER